jgi:adenylate cyclase
MKPPVEEPRTDIRSGLLRVVVAFVLVATLWVGGDHDHAVHAKVVATYWALTTVALMLAWLRRSPSWLSPTFIAIDAGLVLTLFHEHLLGHAPRAHDLTPTNIAVAFMLLTHSAMSLQPKVVLLFSAIFLAGWLGIAAITSPIRSNTFSLWERLAELRHDGLLAVVFVVMTIMLLMLIYDHNRSLDRTVAAERQRSNMQRFFAPEMATEIAKNGLSLGLAERDASVMFIDLRSFTRFAEHASVSELTTVLSEFRSIVSERVFAHGGTIDKFIGDAVLAVFGVPERSAGGKGDALACALDVSVDLQAWAERSLQAGKPSLAAGIGLHHGPVLFGVIRVKTQSAS